MASKLLKKFGVSSSNNSPNNTSAIIPPPPTPQSTVPTSALSTPPSSTAAGLNKSGSSSANTCRFVDVKLPAPANTTQQQPPPKSITTPNTSGQIHSPTTTSSTNTSSSTTSNSSNVNTARNYDPNGQKMFLYNAIIEKENKLKQQKERFQLIDELLKETEKNASKYATPTNLLEQIVQNAKVSSTSNNASATSPTANKPALSLNQLKHSAIDINDIYAHFPEMSTYNLDDVEEFSVFCSRLFQLEETIKSQKDMLLNLESELQRELNNNQIPFSFANGVPTSVAATTASGETPETLELRKEVSLSREQTRIQCKQLHDLDAKMRMNEQNLLQKEQQLQQLLEELYIQEMYADDPLETVIMNSSTDNANLNGSAHNTGNSQEANRSHSRHSLKKTKHIDFENLTLNDESNGNEHQSDDHNRINLNDELDLVQDMSNEVDQLDQLDHHDFHDSNIIMKPPMQQNQNVELTINNELVNNKYPVQNGSMRALNANNHSVHPDRIVTQHNQMNNGHFNNHQIHQNQFGNNLNPSQKSLSYGNLLNGDGGQNINNKSSNNNNSQLNLSPINNVGGSGNAKQQSIYNSKPNTLSSIKLMKSSPSLDINKAVPPFAKPPHPNNAVKNNGYTNMMNGTSDQSGDNDSGISSVSSEANGMLTATSTTTVVNTTLTSSSHTSSTTTLPINVMAYPKQQPSIHSIPIQHQYQQQPMQQQRQFNQNKMQHQNSLTNANMKQQQQPQQHATCSKPVLETLV